MRCPPTAGLILLLLTTAAAQTSRPSLNIPKEMSLDALSQQTFASWHKLEYQLGRAGVKKLEFKVKASCKSPLGSISTTGEYQHDGKRGRLKWQDRKFTTMLAARGWTSESFDRWLDQAGLLTSLNGAKLLATRHTDGSVTIRINGKTHSGHRSLHFDTSGRLSSMELSTGSDKLDVAQVQLRYEKHGKQILTAGWTLQLSSKTGKMSATTRLTHGEIQGFQVITRVEETVTVDGKPFGTQSLLFSDYKLETRQTPRPRSPKPARKN